MGWVWGVCNHQEGGDHTAPIADDKGKQIGRHLNSNHSGGWWSGTAAGGGGGGGGGVSRGGGV